VDQLRFRVTAAATRVELKPSNISACRADNTGIPFVTKIESGRPGPHYDCVLMMPSCHLVAEQTSVYLEHSHSFSDPANV
tara:strand:- start:888 stop:1127 length:240 start_codon:yes stop_codon:yes gene_type:complete